MILNTWNRLIPIGIVVFRYIMVRSRKLLFLIRETLSAIPGISTFKNCIIFSSNDSAGMPRCILPQDGWWKMGVETHKVTRRESDLANISPITRISSWMLTLCFSGLHWQFSALSVESVSWWSGRQASRCWDAWARRSSLGDYFFHFFLELFG